MTQEASISWRPSDASVSLPAETTHLWERLEDLTKLTWPTSAEQIERHALVYWMNPANGGSITDTVVVACASSLYSLSLDSGEEFVAPLYEDARATWQHLTSLSQGESIALARPEYEYTGNGEELEAWQGAQEAAGMDWWRSVMNTLDRLLGSQVVHYFRVADEVQSDLSREMDHRTRASILDAPLSIGANMYCGPIGLGGNLTSIRDLPFHWLNALVASVDSARSAFDETDHEDAEAYKAAAIQLGFLWDLLKGYTWASATSINNLGYYLSRDPESWERTKRALTEGKRALLGAIERLGSESIFPGSCYQETREIAGTPIEDIFEKTEKIIEESKLMASMQLL